MRTEWDYTDLAAAYVKRADYATEAIDEMLKFFGIFRGGVRRKGM